MSRGVFFVVCASIISGPGQAARYIPLEFLPDSARGGVNGMHPCRLRTRRAPSCPAPRMLAPGADERSVRLPGPHRAQPFDILVRSVAVYDHARKRALQSLELIVGKFHVRRAEVLHNALFPTHARPCSIQASEICAGVAPLSSATRRSSIRIGSLAAMFPGSKRVMTRRTSSP